MNGAAGVLQASVRAYEPDKVALTKDDYVFQLSVVGGEIYLVP